VPPRAAYDAVIIGAGPAGSAAAIAFTRESPDLQVALVDQASFPRDKACGDGLGPGVLSVLDCLGLSAILDDEPRRTTVEVRGPGGTRITGALPQLRGKAESGVVMERVRFDQRLYSAAIASGVADYTGWRFTGTAIQGTARMVELARGDESLRLSAGVLVGADGAGSRVRRALGVERNPDRHTGIGIRAYADVRDPGGARPDRLFLDYAEQLTPGYGWVFPLRDGRSNIGVFTVVASFKEHPSRTADMLGRFVERLRSHGYSVSGVSSERTFLLPHAAGLPKLAHPRAALIGDAASMINPWSGEGIFYGMEAGRLLATTTASALGGTDATLDRALRSFERRFRRRFSSHFRGCHLAHRVTRSRAISTRVLRVANRDERVFRYLSSLMFGETGVEPRMLARMAFKGLWDRGRRPPIEGGT
jgi:geranylgeranyl reductase family protein